MIQPYVPLHIHTGYSLLDGLSDIDELVNASKQFGLPALSITDHGSMGGYYKHWKICRKAGIKPLIGAEIYLTYDADTTPRELRHQDNYHLTLLASTRSGLSNLIFLTSQAYYKNFYYKPRVSREALAERSEGIIALSGCLGGEFAASLSDQAQQDKVVGWYREVFGDRYFLEVQPHYSQDQEQLNQSAMAMSRECKIPLVMTLDGHFTCKSDHITHEVLLSIGLKKTLEEHQAGEEMRIPNSCYLWSPEDLLKRSQELGLEEAYHNTHQVASLIEEYDIQPIKIEGEIN